MPTSNPAMNEEVYGRAGLAETTVNAMTVQGSVLKSAVLVVILMVTAGYSWVQAQAGPSTMSSGLLIGGAIGGLITAFATIFFPKISPYSSPVYAALEGLVLGAISAMYNARFPGIMIQAVGLSIGVLVVLLFLYGTGLVRATQRFRTGVIAATGAIFLVYLVGFVLSLFGGHIPYIHQSGPVGIGFSLVVVVIASLNLILDFDFIEQGARRQAPKYMEWYGGFSLLVTLVWMYLEILRLLSKLRSRD
jgi:uncharacterized YccA/Bax inhibitor family protein